MDQTQRVRGLQVFERLFSAPAPERLDSFGEVSVDHLMTQVWDRPGLPLRERRFVTLALLAMGSNDHALGEHVRAAVHSGDLTIEELDEVVLQVAHYGGWPAGARLYHAVRALEAGQGNMVSPESVGPVGLVGLGDVGRGLAAKAAAAGWSVVLHDAGAVQLDRARSTLPAELAGVATSLAELAGRCLVISVAVRDDAQLDSVLDGPDGLVAHARPGTVILVHSTVRPGSVRSAARRAEDSGVVILDAAVSGSLGMHTRSRYTVMIGGPADAVEKVRPLLDAYAQSVLHVGPVGAGMEAKLIRNAVAYGGYASVSEAMALAARLGIDPVRTAEVLRTTALLGPALDLFVRNRWERSDSDHPPEDGARFVVLGRKDLGLAAELGESVGFPLPVSTAARGLMPLVFAPPGTVREM